MTISLVMANIFTACGTTSKDQKALDERTSHQNNGTQPYIKNIGHTPNEDKTAQIPEWDPNKKYAIGDQVKHGNHIFKAIANIKIGDSPANDWKWKVEGILIREQEKEAAIDESVLDDPSIVYKKPRPKNPTIYDVLINGTVDIQASYGWISTKIYSVKHLKHVQNGWNTIYGQKYYIENNKWLIDTTKTIEGKQYGFGFDGVAQEIKDGKDTWDSNTIYHNGDTIIYKGIKYEMIGFSSLDDQPDSTPSKWRAVKGDHPDGKDVWDNNKIYHEGDIVIYKGIKYEMIGFSSLDDQPDSNPSKWKAVK